MTPPDDDTGGFSSEARASLAGLLAQQLGFARTQTDLLVKLSSSLPEFARALDELAAVGLEDDPNAPDPALVKLLGELVATNNSILRKADGSAQLIDTVADLKQFLKEGGKLPQGFIAPPDRDAQRAGAAAALVAGLRKEMASPLEQLKDLFGGLRELGRAALTSKSGDQSRQLAASGATSTGGVLDRLLWDGASGQFAARKQDVANAAARVSGAAGRLNRKMRRGLSSLANTKAGRAAGWSGRQLAGGVRGLARGLSAGRAAGGALSGAMAGGRAGAAAGPLGAVAGTVAGVVAGSAKMIFDKGAGVFELLAGSLTRYLSPVAVVSAAIGSQTSAYSSVGKAFGVLGNTLGLFLLPIFVAFGGLILAVAGEVGERLLPVLKEWAGDVISGAISATQLLQAAFIYAKEQVIAFGQWLTQTRGGRAATSFATSMIPGAALGAAALGYGGQVAKGEAGPDRFREILADIRAGRDPNKGPTGGKPDGETFTQRFLKGVDTMLTEMANGMGAKAQTTSQLDYAKQLQMAALSQTPIEEQNRQLLMKAVSALEEIRGTVGQARGELAQNTRPKPKQ